MGIGNFTLGLKIWTICLLFLVFAVNPLKGQLDGTYTIGTSAGADYSDFSSAADDLENVGISGPVWFNIEAGTYNESVLIEDVSGVSSQDSIVFDGGDPDSVTVEYGAGHTWEMDETLSHTTLKNMAIENTDDTPDEYALYFMGDHVNIWNNDIYKPGGSDIQDIVVRAEGSGHTDFTDNYVDGGSISILLLDGDSSRFEDNTLIEGSTGGIGICGRVSVTEIVGNYMNPDEDGAYNTQQAGIWQGACGGEVPIDDKMVIKNNKIMESAGYGILFRYGNLNLTSDRSLIANNWITGGSASSSSRGGIAFGFFSGDPWDDFDGIDVIHNSIDWVDDNAIIFYTSEDPSDIELYNNSLKAREYAYYFEDDDATVAQSDYNNFYGNFEFDGSTLTSLSDWQSDSGLDDNSQEGDPQYLASGNLLPTAPQMFQNGTFFPELDTDITGKVRNDPPSIGATEILDHDLAVEHVLKPEELGVTPCGEAEEKVEVVLRNLGGKNAGNFYLTAKVDEGNFTDTAFYHHKDSIDAFTSDTVEIGSVNTQPGGVMNFTVHHDYALDEFRGNDTLEFQREFLFRPEAPEVMHDTFCGPQEDVELGVLAEEEADVRWAEDEEGGLFAFGDTITEEITESVTYYVDAQGKDNFCNSDRVPYHVSLNDPSVDLEEGDIFDGNYLGGEEEEPDRICTDDTVQYSIEPSENFNNEDYDEEWTIASYNVLDQDDSPAGEFQLEEPSNGNNGKMTFKPQSTETGDTFRVEIEAENLETGCTVWERHYAYVADRPEAHISVNTDEICFGDSLQIDNHSSIGDEQDVNYNLNFGDGSERLLQDFDTIGHEFAEEGTYEVVMTAESDYGCVDVAKKTVEVSQEVTADFEVAEEEVCKEEEVVFDNLSDTGDEELFYAWLFGDQETSNETNPVHAYEEEGEYDVELIVENDFGCTQTAMKEVQVNPLPEIDFDAPSVACLGEEITFEKESEEQINDFSWTFGDGNSSEAEEPQHAYEVVGNYEVMLTEINEYGCTDSSFHEVEVPEPPVSEFEAELELEDGHMEFEPVEGGLASYLWHFGDGESSEEESPRHQYEEDGVFEVSLTVTDEYGCESTDTAEVEYIWLTMEPGEANNADLQVYPNPAGEQVNIELNSREAMYIRLIDYGGRLVKEARLENGQDTSTWDLSGLEDGSYKLIIEGKNWQKTRGLIIE